MPDFWHRGGSDATIDVWTTALSVSPTHSFQLNDASASAYGEWYSDRLNITGGTNYQLRYNLRYIVTNIGPMRVTVNFYNAANTYLSGAELSVCRGARFLGGNDAAVRRPRQAQ